MIAMTEEERLLLQIENCRAAMNKLCNVKPLFSKEVIQTSQTLDALLNQYEIIKHKKITAIS
jgi:hypothetical protein